MTYKEQCPIKRQEYLLALQQETQACGRTPVYIDETGFSETDFRRYAYAPKGICVPDKVPSQRYNQTTLIAARLEGYFTAPVLFKAVAMRLRLTHGSQRCCVLYLTTDTL